MYISHAFHSFNKKLLLTIVSQGPIRKGGTLTGAGGWIMHCLSTASVFTQFSFVKIEGFASYIFMKTPKDINQVTIRLFEPIFKYGLEKSIQKSAELF